MFGLPIPKFICTHKIKEYIIYEITDLLIDEKIFEQKGPGFCSNILRAKERSADLHLQSFSDSSVETRSNNIFCSMRSPLPINLKRFSAIKKALKKRLFTWSIRQDEWRIKNFQERIGIFELLFPVLGLVSDIFEIEHYLREIFRP